MGGVVVWLFIDTQKRLEDLHSDLGGSRRDGHITHTVIYLVGPQRRRLCGVVGSPVV